LYFFSFLSLPRKLNLDMADFEQRYRALSRQFHPDYFYNAAPAERRASLEKSSYLNDAYRTLRNPISRVDYLLKLEGLAPQGPQQASKQVAAGLLEEVFALNEELDECGNSGQWRSRGRLEGPSRASAPADRGQACGARGAATGTGGAVGCHRRSEGPRSAARSDPRTELHHQSVGWN
jgi:molecular chaperone HscB